MKRFFPYLRYLKPVRGHFAGGMIAAIVYAAASGLDNESEARIQDALQELMKDRPTIIIAHRLSTTKIADRILEFDRGEIVRERDSVEV